MSVVLALALLVLTTFPPRSAAQAPPAAAVDPALLASIEGFAFDTKTRMGVGGFLTFEPVPVVLFKNGDALNDASGLAFAGGLAAHRRANPDDWTTWRRSAGELQTSGPRGWKKLPFQVVYARLPEGFRLDGRYRRLGGTGTLGVGGTSSVAVVTEYEFAPDGTVTRGGAAGSRAEAGDTSTTTSSRSGRRGTYRIDGLVLHLDYADGTREQYVIITDPTDPKSPLWLDGAGFVRRRP